MLNVMTVDPYSWDFTDALYALTDEQMNMLKADLSQKSKLDYRETQIMNYIKAEETAAAMWVDPDEVDARNHYQTDEDLYSTASDDNNYDSDWDFTDDFPN